MKLNKSNDILANLLLLLIDLWIMKSNGVNCETQFDLEKDEHNCELITGECADQGYKFTSSQILNGGGSSSNFATQKAADATIKSFEILMPCSNYLKIFLCGTYKPSCHEEAALIIQPCRSMCEHVYTRCFPVMNKFKKKWSPELNCSRFLDDKSESCMKDNGYKKDLPFTSQEYIKQIDLLLERVGVTLQSRTLSEYDNENYDNYDYDDDESAESFENLISTKNFKKYSTKKNSNLKENPYGYRDKTNLVTKTFKKFKASTEIEKNIEILSSNSKNNNNNFDKYFCFSKSLQQKFEITSTQTLINLNKTTITTILSSPNQPNFSKDKCALKCDADILFNPNEKQFTRIFMIILSSLCLISSLLTILTYFLKSNKYEYPTCIILFMSSCYTIYSIVHLIALQIDRHKIVCDKLDIKEFKYHDNKITQPYVADSVYYIPLDDVSNNSFCSITLLLIYYFRMTSLTWWFILSLCWFLIVQFEVNTQQINLSVSNYFHLIAWTLPAFKTIFILITRTGDTAELTGLCSIGNYDSNALLRYVILPSSLYLFIGLLLISIGSYKIIFIRTIKIKMNSSSINNEKLTSTAQVNTNSTFATSTINNSLNKLHIKIKSNELPPLHQAIADNNIKNSINANNMNLVDYDQNRNSLIRVGIIALLCSLPFIIVTVCELYEYLSIKHWIRLPKLIDLDLSFKVDESIQSTLSYEQKLFELNLKQMNLFDLNNYFQMPNLIIFMIKIFMGFLNSFLILFLLIMNISFKTRSDVGNGLLDKKIAKTEKQTNKQFLAKNINENCFLENQSTGIEIYSSNDDDDDTYQVNNDSDHSYQFSHQYPQTNKQLFIEEEKQQQIQDLRIQKCTDGMMSKQKIQCDCVYNNKFINKNLNSSDIINSTSKIVYYAQSNDAQISNNIENVCYPTTNSHHLYSNCGLVNEMCSTCQHSAVTTTPLNDHHYCTPNLLMSSQQYIQCNLPSKNYPNSSYNLIEQTHSSINNENNNNNNNNANNENPNLFSSNSASRTTNVSFNLNENANTKRIAMSTFQTTPVSSFLDATSAINKKPSNLKVKRKP